MKYKKNFGIICFTLLAFATVIIFSKYKNHSEIFNEISLEPINQAVLNSSIYNKEISLENLFDGLINIDGNNSISILVTGDLMPGRYVNIQSRKAQDDLWAYRNLTAVFENKFVFANLESPIITDCPDKSDGMIFCAPEYAAKSLSEVGIDIVSLANNHSLNYGRDGLNETISFLDKYGIKYTGVNNPTVIEIEDKKVAFLGYDDVECNSKYIECAEETNIVDDLKQSRELADISIVMFHWGSEYRHIPTSRQTELAKLAIDSGADLVLGNHPHWYQTYELYKGKIIAYSHGNFIFDQMWSTKTREGILAEYFIQDDLFADVNIIPILISNYGQPALYDQINSQRIVDHIKSMSLTQ